jgi:hypothetical protein
MLTDDCLKSFISIGISGNDIGVLVTDFLAQRFTGRWQKFIFLIAAHQVMVELLCRWHIFVAEQTALCHGKVKDLVPYCPK